MSIYVHNFDFYDLLYELFPSFFAGEPGVIQHNNYIIKLKKNLKIRICVLDHEAVNYNNDYIDMTMLNVSPLNNSYIYIVFNKVIAKRKEVQDSPQSIYMNLFSEPNNKDIARQLAIMKLDAKLINDNILRIMDKYYIIKNILGNIVFSIHKYYLIVNEQLFILESSIKTGEEEETVIFKNDNYYPHISVVNNKIHFKIINLNF